jgi:hypothetical protein
MQVVVVEMKEKKYYAAIKQKFTELFESKGYKAHFEITADKKKFSNLLKSKIQENRRIIFAFLAKSQPDITGFVSKRGSTDFVIIDVNPNELDLDSIYQARRYAKLFYARYAFLVSNKEIPEEIKKLEKIVSVLSLPDNRNITLAQFEAPNAQVADELDDLSSCVKRFMEEHKAYKAESMTINEAIEEFDEDPVPVVLVKETVKQLKQVQEMDEVVGLLKPTLDGKLPLMDAQKNLDKAIQLLERQKLVGSFKDWYPENPFKK